MGISAKGATFTNVGIVAKAENGGYIDMTGSKIDNVIKVAVADNESNIIADDINVNNAIYGLETFDNFESLKQKGLIDNAKPEQVLKLLNDLKNLSKPEQENLINKSGLLKVGYNAFNLLAGLASITGANLGFKLPF